MAKNFKGGKPQAKTNGVVREAIKYGPVVTFLLVGLISFGVGYLIYSFLLSGWSESAAIYRQEILKKEMENQKTENMLAEEPQFLEKYNKIVSLYQQAKPLLPEETEVSEVLGQVETAARRNGVVVTGLMAVKESVKSPMAQKVYEREIPAVVNGTYPQVVAFFTDISRMSRILVVRDYSIGSMKNGVTAGFTLVAYHAPPPSEKGTQPATVAENKSGGNNVK